MLSYLKILCFGKSFLSHFFFVKAFVSSPKEMGNTGDAAWSWGPLCTKYKQKVSEEMSQWCLHRLIYLDKSTGTRVIKIVLR